MMEADDIKQEKITGKTPPHDPTNGFQLNEAALMQDPDAGAYQQDDYGNGNGGQPAPPVQTKEDPDQADITNEYGSME